MLNQHPPPLKKKFGIAAADIGSCICYYEVYYNIIMYMGKRNA